MEVLRAGLTGLGFMGAAHLHNYGELSKNGVPVKLVAVCDTDENKLNVTEAAKGNINIGSAKLDLSQYNLYTDIKRMIEKENLDIVDLCLPTYLHGPMAIEAMESGVNVFSEKPMAISSAMCQQMIDTSERTGKRLMIGHTLRYWDSYEYLKSCVEDKRYGACVSAYFFRGGGTPVWSWNNWLLQKEKSGGCLLDQHVHDVDLINWLFGLPEAVTSIGKVVNIGNGYDVVSTNYIYGDKVINAQDDWTINGDFGFDYTYRVNFETGAVVLKDGATTVYPADAPKFAAELHGESGYYKELRLFVENLTGKSHSLDFIGLLESHRGSIRLAEAEMESCDKNGDKVYLQ